MWIYLGFGQMEWASSLQWQLIYSHETKARRHGNQSVKQANSPFLEERDLGPSCLHSL